MQLNITWANSKHKTISSRKSRRKRRYSSPYSDIYRIFSAFGRWRSCPRSGKLNIQSLCFVSGFQSEKHNRCVLVNDTYQVFILWANGHGHGHRFFLSDSWTRGER